MDELQNKGLLWVCLMERWSLDEMGVHAGGWDGFVALLATGFDSGLVNDSLGTSGPRRRRAETARSLRTA